MYEVYTNGKTWFACKAVSITGKERKEGYQCVATCEEWTTAQTMALFKTNNFRCVAELEATRRKFDKFDMVAFFREEAREPVAHLPN
jgi:hypothetical protein